MLHLLILDTVELHFLQRLVAVYVYSIGLVNGSMVLCMTMHKDIINTAVNILRPTRDSQNFRI